MERKKINQRTKNNYSVGIVILNWNGWRDTLDCLKSLKELDYSTFSIVIVDNGSEDDSVKKIKYGAKKIGFEIKEIGGLKYQRDITIHKNEKNFGFAKGNNEAIKILIDKNEPDIFLLLNNDVLVDKYFLKNLVVAASKDVEVGVAGPAIYFYDEGKTDIVQSFGGRVNFWCGDFTALYEGKVSNTLKRQTVPYVYGTCFLVKKKVFKDIGLLDESFFFYGEETDFCIRARKKGYKILAEPSSKIWHKDKGSVKKMSGFALFNQTKNLFVLIKKHAHVFQFASFLIYFFIIKFPWKIFKLKVIIKDDSLLRKYLKGIKEGLLC